MKESTRKLFDNVAVELQKNIEKEADAIKSYQELLNQLRWKEDSGNADEEKTADMLCDQIEEFISDELNHQATLHDLYILLTAIKEATD